MFYPTYRIDRLSMSILVIEVEEKLREAGINIHGQRPAYNKPYLTYLDITGATSEDIVTIYSIMDELESRRGVDWNIFDTDNRNSTEIGIWALVSSVTG